MNFTQNTDKKAAVLSCLDLILSELGKDTKNDRVLQYACTEILKIWLSKQYQNLSTNEIVIAEIIAESTLTDYINQEVDYAAIRVNGEFAYQAILQGLSDETKYAGATLSVDTNDVLVNWKLTSGNPENSSSGFFIQWNVLDKIYNENKNLSKSYPNFDKHSLKLLSTVRLQENEISINKSRDLFAYNGWVVAYLSVFERELRNVIRLIDSNPKKEKLMLRKLCEEIIKMRSANFHFMDMAEIEGLISIRNKAAHGEELSKEDYEYCKKTLNSNYFENLSELKGDLKDDTTLNHLKLMKFLSNKEGKDFIKEFQSSPDYKDPWA
ncbi:hypothetical protein [Fictibacillus barbaricus]|uniref:Apea-like HEPN domain-containing protein n=1 Tax=Fictibacillus barbaricus TaxID=182136 RepID=A0ABS2ZHG1_9BACL|nr:hypothetical protein [Fictibacillus barbaricus]MBN3546876.1 hypothetical protein [Fictibacillus barbaricus]